MTQPMRAAVGGSASVTPEQKRVLAATLIGTSIEWYDYFIYAQAAGLVLGPMFFGPFSKSNPSLSQIISFATIGIAFLFRPLGAIVCGHVDTTYWRDLGTPGDFVAGSADLVRGLAPSGAVPGPVGDALVLEGAVVGADAVLCGGTTIGARVEVGAGTLRQLGPGGQRGAGRLVRP